MQSNKIRDKVKQLNPNKRTLDFSPTIDTNRILEYEIGHLNYFYRVTDAWVPNLCSKSQICDLASNKQADLLVVGWLVYKHVPSTVRITITSRRNHWHYVTTKRDLWNFFSITATWGRFSSMKITVQWALCGPIKQSLVPNIVALGLAGTPISDYEHTRHNQTFVATASNIRHGMQ